MKIKLWYFRSKSCKFLFLQIKVDYENYIEGFLVIFYFGDDIFIGIGSNKMIVKDKVLEEVLEILSLKLILILEKKGIEKIVVIELNEFC